MTWQPLKQKHQNRSTSCWGDQSVEQRLDVNHNASQNVLLSDEIIKVIGPASGV